MLLQFNFSFLLETQQRKLSPLKRANIIKVRCEFTVGQKLCSNETAVCVVWSSEVCSSGQSFSPYFIMTQALDGVAEADRLFMSLTVVSDALYVL